MNTKILSTSKEDIALAGEIIRGGGLVAFPTETVYGLGADALNPEAVRGIFAAKGRPADNPLIVHIAEKEDIIPLVREVTPKAQALIDAFFPAPLTVILPKSDRISEVVSGGLDTVAVRMPENETARLLIKAAGRPIAAPSANTSGLPSPTRAKYVIDDMNGIIDAVIDGGDCKFGVESTVITLAKDIPEILRPGAITREMLEAVIGEVAVSPSVLEGMSESEAAASPGMKYKHYSPKAKIVIVNADKDVYERFVNSKNGAFALCFDGDGVSIPHLTYGAEENPLAQAHELFDALRQLDEAGAEKVYARAPRPDGVGMAVYNRLIRAAAFNIIDLKKPFTIGLTGLSGSGKGYVCEILAENGLNILDTDAVVAELYKTDKALIGALEAEFGSGIINGGEVDKAALRKIVFADRNALDRLNALVHPAVIAACEKLAEVPSVLDAPQLFESGAQDKCYKTVCVTADEKTRLARIMRRDCISEEQAKARFASQLDENYLIKRSDFIINNSDGEDIKKQINDILEAIL